MLLAFANAKPAKPYVPAPMARSATRVLLMSMEDRSKAIDSAIGQIEKQFGRGAIMRLGDKNQLDIEAIPTGALSLDLALGIGGIPRGRITEIFGPESSG